jgi:hypothetical protein
MQKERLKGQYRRQKEKIKKEFERKIEKIKKVKRITPKILRQIKEATTYQRILELLKKIDIEVIKVLGFNPTQCDISIGIFFKATKGLVRYIIKEDRTTADITDIYKTIQELIEDAKKEVGFTIIDWLITRLVLNFFDEEGQNRWEQEMYFYA